MAKVSSEDIKDFFVEGGKLVAGVALNFYGESLNQAGDEAFSDAIEVGIGNTVAALYDADVGDDVIIRLLNKYWGIGNDEAEERLIFEKSQAAVRELKRYLKLQGYSTAEVTQFMRTSKASIKIKHGAELRKLRRNLEKLMKAVQEP